MINQNFLWRYVAVAAVVIGPWCDNGHKMRGTWVPKQFINKLSAFVVNQREVQTLTFDSVCYISLRVARVSSPVFTSVRGSGEPKEKKREEKKKKN